MKHYLTTLKSLWRRFEGLDKKKKLVILALIIGLFVVIAIIPSESELEDSFEQTREVTLISVAESSTESTPLLLTGVVRSQTEAQLRTESQGEVTGVYVSPGDFVYAGTVLAELRNTAERAAVQQAEAGLDAALANYAKNTGSVRSEDRSILEANVKNAENGLRAANTSALSLLQTGYATFDDAVTGKTDVLFTNPNSANPQFRITSSESQIANTISKNRIKIGEILQRHEVIQPTLTSTSDLVLEIRTLEDDMLLLQNYIDSILVVLNNAIPSPSITSEMIASFRFDVANARTSVNATLSGLTGAISAISNAETGVVVAEENLQRGLIGAQAEDVVALQAQVNQARAGLSAARANLARTLIITPIPGTVNTLSLRAGDFVSAFSPAATVSNNNALEVIAYITEDDADYIKVGSAVRIDEQHDGVVTSIAPGLDPITKKREVRIGIQNENTKLTSGASASIAIERNGFDIDLSTIQEISVPVSSLKIETDRIVVFSVSDESTLVPHEVETGLIFGDKVRITNGIDATFIIVADARGLRDNQEVAVKGIE